MKSRKKSRIKPIVEFLKPTKWKLLLATTIGLAYFIEQVSWFVNLPINIIWNVAPRLFFESLKLPPLLHALYYYILASALIKIWSERSRWSKPPDGKGFKTTLIRFVWPTKWKLVILVFLYVSNWLSFFGIIFNFPIFYVYWNWAPVTDLAKTALFVAHIVYLYLLSSLFVRIFG